MVNYKPCKKYMENNQYIGKTTLFTFKSSSFELFYEKIYHFLKLTAHLISNCPRIKTCLLPKSLAMGH